MSIYAIQSGKRAGLFSTWHQTEREIRGIRSAEWRRFDRKRDAVLWLLTESEPNLAEGSAAAFVDGCYDPRNRAYGAGVLIVSPEGDINRLSLSIKDPDWTNLTNIAGELQAVIHAATLAADCGYPALTIYHDYDGIAGWATGTWNAATKATVAYTYRMRQLEKELAIHFIKVPAHQNRGNLAADTLARAAAGLTPRSRGWELTLNT
ncbi:viroplasmin family protein [Sporolactobacillus vineae]|uniref:ribonuclease H1 domain-containing protein n=1 Tax=Sporolactobacillus vineae TaxID=444463 RepID=UPI0002883DD6|nr:viroplasmin family protein [Sporolactobacillus vineae]